MFTIYELNEMHSLKKNSIILVHGLYDNLEFVFLQVFLVILMCRSVESQIGEFLQSSSLPHFEIKITSFICITQPFMFVEIGY